MLYLGFLRARAAASRSGDGVGGRNEFCGFYGFYRFYRLNPTTC
jgi:hypothetical protein